MDHRTPSSDSFETSVWYSDIHFTILHGNLFTNRPLREAFEGGELPHKCQPPGSFAGSHISTNGVLSPAPVYTSHTVHAAGKHIKPLGSVCCIGTETSYPTAFRLLPTDHIHNTARERPAYIPSLNNGYSGRNYATICYSLTHAPIRDMEAVPWDSDVLPDNAPFLNQPTARKERPACILMGSTH